MAKFTADHKKDRSSNYFDEGIHKVKIAGVEFDELDDGREFAEFTVVDEDDREGTARLWFSSDAAINYSFNIIRGIFVHNAPENKKDAVRESFDKIEDTEQLEKSINELLIGGECWYQVSKSDRTYESNGQIKHSYDRNIYGYEPAPKKVTPDPEIEDVEISEEDKAEAKKTSGGKKITGF